MRQPTTYHNHEKKAIVHSEKIPDYQWDRSFSDLAGILTSNRIYGKYYHLGDEILYNPKISDRKIQLFDTKSRNG